MAAGALIRRFCHLVPTDVTHRRKKVRCDALLDHEVAALTPDEVAFTYETESGEVEPLTQPPCANCKRGRSKCIFSRNIPKRETGKTCVSCPVASERGR